jgi:butyrate kinase
MTQTILVINPGSTSTKLAVFWEEEEALFSELQHDSSELEQYFGVMEQYAFRRNLIERFLNDNNVSLPSLSAVVARGGLLHPIASGTYRVNDRMVEDLKRAKYGEHASNLGAVIAKAIGKRAGIPAFIVDPVVVDELVDIARLSGHPDLPRLSMFHALNSRAAARKAAKSMGRKYEEVSLIVAHLGGGISVGLHHYGRVIDVNNALDGDGPYTPERTGALPSGQLARLCFSGKLTQQEIARMIQGSGGLVAYLGTNSSQEVIRRIEEGDTTAKTVYRAMAYQIAKEIMSLFPGAFGEIDAVVLTGGMAHDDRFLVPWIKEMLGKRVRVIVVSGSLEMEALAQGALRVLRGVEAAKEY